MAREKKITVYDIARLAGVSTATVSRVINNNLKVDFSTRKKILEICRENNYTPLEKKKPKTINIGIVINKVTDPAAQLSEYISEIIQGALEFCQTGNMTLSVFALDPSSFRTSESIVQEFLSRNIQGAILINPRANAEYVETLIELNYPCVCVGSFFTNPKISSINIDNREGIRLAVEHLKSQGHSQINFVGIQSSDYDSAERMEAFSAYTSGEVIQIKSIDGDHKKTTCSYFDKKITEGKLNLPDAYICLNDNVAIGLIHALKKHGIQVPEQVSVVGYDNYSVSKYYTPSLSTVKNPILKTGYLACSTILDFINGNKAVLRRLIIPTFIARESSGKCILKNRIVPSLENTIQEND